MHLKVEELSKVDRKIHIHAGKEDLAPRITEALKKVRRQVQMPGFRVGQAPMAIVEKRFAAEIRQEEAGKFVDEVFREQILPEHKPIGQPVLEDLHFHGDELHAVLLLSIKPEINVVDLKSVTLDRMVHDVAEKDVDLEIGFVLRREANWVDATTVTTESKLKVHSQEVDASGKKLDVPLETGVEIDLNLRDNVNLVDKLVGKKVGDKAVVTYDDRADAQTFELEIASIQNPEKPELTDEWVKTSTNGDANTVDEYRSRVKSRIQAYYDQISRDLAKNILADRMVDLHAFDVPKLTVDTIVRGTFERLIKEQGEANVKAQLEDENFLKTARARAERQAKWMFISEEIRERNGESLEVTEKDIDGFIAAKAAEYGLPAETLKPIYLQNEEAYIRLQQDIADEKLFNFLLDEVSSVELSRDAYEEKYKRSDA